MTFNAQVTMEKALVKTEVAALKQMEKTTKAAVGKLAVEILHHVQANGDNTLMNELLDALSPANRTAVTLFYIEMTEFKYDGKEKNFPVKNKKLKEEEKEKRAKARNDFAVIHKYNFWDWYTSTKADKIVEIKFSEQTLVKQLVNFMKINKDNPELENMLAEMLEGAKRTATGKVAEDSAKDEQARTAASEWITNRTIELMDYGMPEETAGSVAAEDYKKLMAKK